MSGVCRLNDIATCNHIIVTGSSNVFINGLPCARVGKDIAGGIIIGPGNPTVLVNGLPISIIGDAILPHGDKKHKAAVTVTGSPNVLA
jgi:uncharacterized Zn-binding protein involved in type VI secretion